MRKVELATRVVRPCDIAKAREEAHGLGRFVRSLVQLDRVAAAAAFDRYLFDSDRSNPDVSEAWSTPVPVDKKWGYALCSEVETGAYGGGPALTPVSAVEQTIWNSAKGNSIYKRQRSTLTNVYVRCVEHDAPDLLKD